MVISELTLGYLTNLIYDSSKNIPREIFDTYSKVYDKVIEEFSNKNYKLSGIQIDTFFHQKNVEKAIEKYLKNPDKLDCSDVLIQEFFELFSEEVFSCENADLILNTFFETIDAEIEKDPELRAISSSTWRNKHIKQFKRQIKEFKSYLKASKKSLKQFRKYAKWLMKVERIKVEKN
jgi:hypothetical protein